MTNPFRLSRLSAKKRFRFCRQEKVVCATDLQKKVGLALPADTDAALPRVDHKIMHLSGEEQENNEDSALD
jgi:hypothetical protein